MQTEKQGGDGSVVWMTYVTLPQSFAVLLASFSLVSVPNHQGKHTLRVDRKLALLHHRCGTIGL